MQTSSSTNRVPVARSTTSVFFCYLGGTYTPGFLLLPFLMFSGRGELAGLLPVIPFLPFAALLNFTFGPQANPIPAACVIGAVSIIGIVYAIRWLCTKFALPVRSVAFTTGFLHGLLVIWVVFEMMQTIF